MEWPLCFYPYRVRSFFVNRKKTSPAFEVVAEKLASFESLRNCSLSYRPPLHLFSIHFEKAFDSLNRVYISVILYAGGVFRRN